MALTNSHYLIQKAAEAYERSREATTTGEEQYWIGAAEAYESLFNNAFDTSIMDGQTLKMAKLVFSDRKTYDSALAEVRAENYYVPNSKN